MNKQEKQENDEEKVVPAYHDEGEIILNPQINMRGHRWVQQGYSIICMSCPLRHSFNIGPDYILVGIEDGLPKLVKRK